MADIAIETNAYRTSYTVSGRGGIFWTSATVGYAFFVLETTPKELCYSKTTDGGNTWGVTVSVSDSPPEALYAFDCWADWQTSGDSGTKIHIVYLERDEGNVNYRYLDTATDTLGTSTGIYFYGAATFHSQVTREHHSCSIAKGRGGKLAIAYRVTDTGDAQLEGFYTSPDGVTWTSKTVPWEDAEDYIQLYCGNETDDDDIWASFWDKSADEISLKTYDDSGNSWSEQSIAGSMVDSNSYLQMDGQVRLSDGHLIFAAWDAVGFAGTANLKTWDINGASSITAKTNVIVDTQHYFNVSVFINQMYDDIYAAYIGGTGILSQAAALYKKSTDGGTTWGDETAMQANAEDDERWISAGCTTSTLGGYFMPVWFNDDLDALYCNTDNAIEIQEIATPTATVQDATNIGCTTVQLNGTISDDGGGSCEARFRYRSGTTWTETSWQDTLETDDTYYAALTEIDQGTRYEFQTQAKNNAGEGDWSSSAYFDTEDRWRDFFDAMGRLIGGQNNFPYIFPFSFYVNVTGREIQSETGTRVLGSVSGRFVVGRNNFPYTFPFSFYTKVTGRTIEGP